MAPQNTQYRVRFAPVDSASAARGRNATSAQSNKARLTPVELASVVPVGKLALASNEKQAVQALYSGTSGTAPVEHVYQPDNADDQTAAAALLCSHGLDIDSREAFGNKWRGVWSTQEIPKGSKSKKIAKKEEKTRLLLQCVCGYHHAERGYKSRHSAFAYTGCYAHAEITFLTKSKKILRVRGFLDHNAACDSAEVAAVPMWPVHPEVYEVALKQLALGATLTDILERNQQLFRTPKGYQHQPSDLKTSRYRWLLSSRDSRSLYRQHHRMTGISVEDKPHVNIDEWLDPESPKFNAELRDAVFYYRARAAEDERFKVCISTKEMKEAAWKYSHGQQMILDGTFGVCDSKMLLFIVMGLDENRHGVPLAFLLFSAPTQNKKTSAGYDTAILTELLGAWRDSLGLNDAKEAFAPLIVITDTDARERAALLRVWPKVYLLLCKFHLRQCWRNHRNTSLKGKSPVLSRLKQRLARLEQSLVESVKHDAALALINTERTTLEAFRAESKSAVEKAIEHLDYLQGYWLTEDLWKSWSAYGRLYAANLLGRPVCTVLTTTNHLEAFNRVLKRTHLVVTVT
ncbi:hypothetical protein EXIGLDRAFT_780756 [Exidia glandulosa HHB12029]|uniref:MULE transposase domain-containing protein n=1 Tax=Exidia glandulosa HHB12029 TaxID=1314781 RepID=A0A165Z9K1_EXIGL|nr:hypothetical protein EXIGLDRAFT_780756 [Exidia glandulosa HHB12029]